jgi:hypothetical protein
MNQYYSPDAKNPPGAAIAQSKPQLLDDLANTNDEQWTGLKNAYNDPKDPRTGVLRTGISVIDSTITNTGTVTTMGSHGGVDISGSDAGGTEAGPPQGGNWGGGIVWNAKVNKDVQMDQSSENTSGGGSTDHQTVTNTDFGYRVPFLEAKAQYTRAQISLIDQRFAQFMAGYFRTS